MAKPAMLTMAVITNLENNDRFTWDDYVERSPAGTFYHLSGWKYVLEHSFGFKPIYLLARDETGQIIGVLPLFLMTDIIRRRYLISIPSSNYAGVCASDDEISVKILNEAKKIALEKKVQYIELRQLNKKVYDLPTRNDFVTMHLELSNDEEFIWKNSLNSKARNQVRKAYGEGLKVDFGRKYLDDFYRILSIKFKELGTPVLPINFFRTLLDVFNASTNIIVVKCNNKVIGGMFFTAFKKIFSDPWASTLTTYNNLCPSNILYWEAIKYACRNGFETFDFGRSTINSGTFRFKKQWGAQPVQLHYQYFLNRANKLPEVSAFNNQYQTAINLWKKLPLTVTKTIGPIIVKYLPEY